MLAAGRLSRAHASGFVVHWYGRCAPHLPALYAEEAPFGRANSQQRHVARSGTPTTNKRHHGSINLAIKHILAARLLNGSRVLLYHRDAASRKKDTDSARERLTLLFIACRKTMTPTFFGAIIHCASGTKISTHSSRVCSLWGWMEHRVTLIPVLCIERRDYYSDTFTRSSLKSVF
jgi:hypothetical protein